MSIMTIEVLVLEEMKKLYEVDLCFVEVWKEIKNPRNYDRTIFMEYFSWEVFLFRNNKLCIPTGSFDKRIS